ncbi:MAG: PAS domain-containing protein [Azoarcus sp.]|nr:PAS domain-containing protein [Azoarcus sp.]
MDAEEDRRLAELQAYGILDTTPETAFDRLVEIAAKACGTPIATVTLVDGERQWFKAKLGIGAPQTSRPVAFCDHTVRDTCLFEVSDALADARFASNPLVTGPPHIRFYAGAPLIAPSGRVMGAFCVMDHEPRKLTSAQRDLLCLLAQQTMLETELRARSLRLDEARIEAERAESESIRLAERLKTTLESFTDAFYTVDREWRFTYVNREAERVLQRCRDDLIGRNVWDEFPEVVDSPLRSAYLRAFETGATEHLEFYFPPLESWFEVHAYPSPEGLAVYFRDITRRKRDETAMSALRTELERSNMELRHFASIASHDLREPLRKLQVFADRLLGADDMPADQRADYLRRMGQAAARMDALLDALLRYSRVIRYQRPLRPVALAEVVEEVREDLELELAGGCIVVEGDLPILHADRDQIRQAVQNLVANGLKYRHPERAPHVVIRSCTSADEASAVIEVEDNGTGFDPAHAGRIFEPFVRLSPMQGPDGSGMGLAIVQSVVMRHGGRISADGRPGEGACFRLVLPCAPASNVRTAGAT